MAATTGEPLRLPGFTYRRVDVGTVSLNVATAGRGPAVLFLHGYPQSHVMWRDVAPHFTDEHTVVLADLRGYGDSDAPTPDAAGDVYAKRTMAADQVALMRTLGFDRFDLVAHDRGARVAHRLVLDHPDVVRRLALLDIMPTRHVLQHVDRALATAYYHWFLLGAGHGIPEHLLRSDPGYWVRSIITTLLGRGASIPDDVMDEYVRVFTDDTVDGTCADYRAGASIDLVHDDESWDRGDRIAVPTLALWGEQSFVERGYETLDVWRTYAEDIRGHAIPAGHFVAEEQPEVVTAELLRWIDG